MVRLRDQITGFCLIILLALGLRFSGICHDSLWLDESYQTLAGACGNGVPDFTSSSSRSFLFRFDKPNNPGAMLRNFRSVDPLCPPLYQLILNRWMSFFGLSDLALRSLSATISVLSVALLTIFARVLLGPRIALLTGLLCAVSPYDIHYGQEVRMYGLVQLCAIVSTASLICAIKSGLKKTPSLLLLPLYIVSTWAMINSHYTSLFLALSQGLASVGYLCLTRKWRTLLLLSISWLSIALCWLPWLPLFLKSAASRKESFYVARVPDLIWPFKALFLRVPINWLAFMSGQRVLAYAFPLYLSSAFMLVSALFHARREHRLSFQVSALLIWAFLPALILWGVDLIENHRVVEVSRYLIFTAPAIYMLAAYGLSALSGFKRLFQSILFCHLIFAGLNIVYTHTVKQREPWREMALCVEELVPADDLLVVSQHYNIACLDRYLKSPRRQMGMSPAMGADFVDEKLSLLSRFALLTAQEGESIKDMVPRQFKLLKQVDMAHGLHLRIYERQDWIK